MIIVKYVTFSLSIVFLTAFLSCQTKPSGEKATTGDALPSASVSNLEAEKFMVQTGQLNWTASKTGGQHLGTVEVAGGEIMVKGNEVLSGNFEVNLPSIQSIDLEGERKAKLENHLKSADFFDVDQYPTATFAIVSSKTSQDVPMATHIVTGNLTIKDITKSIEIPVNISFVGDKLLAATPAFTIDRTEWDLKYRSSLLGTAPDKLIHDEISLVVTLDAAK